MSIHRRAFLAASVAQGIGLCAVAGEPPPRVISFSFSLYGMRTLTLEAALTACARIGYDAVELALMPTYRAEPSRLSRDDRRQLRERLRELRLGLPALMENLPLDGADAVHRTNLDRLRAACELGRDLSPDQPPLIETILGGGVDRWEKLKGQFATRLGDWARIAETNRTIVAIKPHRFGAMNLPSHALWLLEQVRSPWIKVAYDFSHYQHRDLTMADTLKSLLPQTRFVHVKDTRMDNARATFVLPGEAGVDYPALLRQLDEGRYAGTFCVEVSGMVQNVKGYDPIAAARRSYDNVEPAFRAARIRRRP